MSTTKGALPLGIQMVRTSALPMMGRAMAGMPVMGTGPGMATHPMGATPMLAPMVPCRVVREMSADCLTVKLKAVDAEATGPLEERCDALNALSAMSAPTTIACGAMPLPVCAPQTRR